MALSPNLQAELDQMSAAVRDTYKKLGVDLADPAQLHAVRCTWWLIVNNPSNWMLGAISEVVTPTTT
jgi:hypothetical protein